jgi:hypothetical protein
MRGNESIAPARDSQPVAPSQIEWRTVDRALRAIAARRAGLDAEELSLLREAEALQIAEPAVAAALAALGPAVRVEQLIAEALRRCQRPISLVENRPRGSSCASNDSPGLSRQ